MVSKELAKNPMGPPTKINDQLIANAHDYLTHTIKGRTELPTIEGLALAINVSRETIYEWERTGVNKQISDIVRQTRTSQAQMLIQKGLNGDFNPTITKLLLSKHGYVEKQEVDNTHTVVQPILGGKSIKKVENEATD